MFYRFEGDPNGRSGKRNEMCASKPPSDTDIWMECATNELNEMSVKMTKFSSIIRMNHRPQNWVYMSGNRDGNGFTSR